MTNITFLRTIFLMTALDRQSETAGHEFFHVGELDSFQYFYMITERISYFTYYFSIFAIYAFFKLYHPNYYHS